jgi:hypothetical protein
MVYLSSLWMALARHARSVLARTGQNMKAVLATEKTAD